MELDYEVENELLKFIEKKFGINALESSTAIYSRMAAGTKKYFIHDEYDRQVPIERLFEMVEHNPDATIHRTYSLGHTRILRDTSTHQKIIDFINE